MIDPIEAQMLAARFRAQDARIEAMEQRLKDQDARIAYLAGLLAGRLLTTGTDPETVIRETWVGPVN